MANIQNIPLNESLRLSNPKVNQNFQNLNNEIATNKTDAENKLEEHKNSTSAHAAQNITYSGDIIGASNVKQALDNTKQTIDDLILGSGDSGPEVAAARGGYTTLGDRLDASDEQLVNTARVYNLKNNLIDGESDYTVAFQRGLDLANIDGSAYIYVPAGEYIVSNSLRVYAHTTIEMHPQAVIKRGANIDFMFVNGERGNENYATGYEGDGDLHFIGGTYDLNASGYPPVLPTGYGCVAFAIAHAERVSFTNVSIKNGQNNHYIDLCACKEVFFSRCKFSDMNVTGSDNYEVVQINSSIAGAFPAFGSTDYTPCVNLKFEGCDFRNTFCGIGDHMDGVNSESKRIFQENIIITGCTFKDMKSGAIRPQSFKNLIIENNVIDGVSNAQAIRGFASDNVIISNNIIMNVSGTDAVVMYQSGSYLPSNIKIINNIIINVGNQGISVNANFSEIAGNKLENIGSNGIRINMSQKVEVYNNRIFGVSQSTDNSYDAFSLANSSDTVIRDNSADNSAYTKGMRYGVHNPSGNIRTINLRNRFLNVKTLEFNNNQTDVIEGKTIGERRLTESLTVSSGSVTLLDDITKYRYVIIGTGTASGGGLRTEIARGWYNEGFRPGTDFINVSTNNGKFIASIDTKTQITVVSTNDPLRYIIGIP